MTKLIFEKSGKDKRGTIFPQIDFNENYLENFVDKKYLRTTNCILPEVTEGEVMRHFVNLSQQNFSVDNGFYPLGSCTMKYNPKVNELAASLDGFANIHPNQPDNTVQGALSLMYELQEQLKVITGMDAISLQPSAGAHGELAGMMVIKAYFDFIGEKRTKVIVPDSAHGTNPASAKMCGFDIVQISSDEKGLVDVEQLKLLVDENTAALMLTNPNTLGLFEENILEISKIVHNVGGLLYYDGANFNAIMGITNPAIMGFDVVHINLHKTFSTPHGGGGPGAGPIGVAEKLKEFLPVPTIEFDGKNYFRNYNHPNSIGKVSSFFGNFGVFVRAYTYIKMMGKTGLKQASYDAVMNANYIKEKLKKYYQLPFDRTCMHEFVFSGDLQKEQGVNTMAIAKRLIDYGFHPPTVYFPLIVHEAIMIEPTETESKETLDEFIEVMIKIAKEVEENKEIFETAPNNTAVSKIDETYVARNPNLKWDDTKDKLN